MTATWLTLALSALLGASGCRFVDKAVTRPGSVAAARGELREMQELDKVPPISVRRPVVILSGWRDPGLFPARMASTVRELVGDQSVLTLHFFLEGSFPSCRDRLLSAVQERWPSDDPAVTVEVDVIAHSMGGLVARYAALPPDAEGFDGAQTPRGRRLRIANLYSVATPHRGARLAPLAYWDETARGMVAGSGFLDALDRELVSAPYRLVPYAVRGDIIVGSRRSSPPKQTPRAFPMRFLMPSHLNAMSDPRVMLDIVRELQAETKFDESCGTPRSNSVRSDGHSIDLQQGSLP